MSDETLESIQNLFRYCPICGDDTPKDFAHYSTTSGEWVCVACEEYVEVYLVENEETDEVKTDRPSSSLLLVFIIIILAAYIYVT